MRFIPIDYLREGMMVGRPLYGKNGELLLGCGIVLRDSYIRKLRAANYNGIYIEDDLSEGIMPAEVIDSGLRAAAVKAVKDTFASVAARASVGACIGTVRTLAEQIVESILGKGVLAVNMIDLKAFDEYTFHHCVNVGVVSTVMGVRMGQSRHTLYKLALSGLLHDIGKIFVPKEILNKEGPLDDQEFAVMRRHSEEGYDYLMRKGAVPLPSCVGALQHHERLDGSGYPRGLHGLEISWFGRVLGIVDVYDALTSDRPYRRAMLPSDAVEYVMGGTGTLFDLQVVRTFMETVSPYPEGLLRVVAHDGENVNPYELDLAEHEEARSVTIVEIIG